MGEFNVDKTTGDLIPTAGMPGSYPASQVMMSDGVTSVEDAVDAVTPRTIKSVTADGAKTYAQLLVELAGLGIGGNALKIGGITFCNANTSNYYSCYFGGNNIIDIYCVYMTTSTALYKKASMASNGTVFFTDLSDNVPASGTKIERVYV